MVLHRTDPRGAQTSPWRLVSMSDLVHRDSLARDGLITATWYGILTTPDCEQKFDV